MDSDTFPAKHLERPRDSLQPCAELFTLRAPAEADLETTGLIFRARRIPARSLGVIFDLVDNLSAR